MEYQYIVNPKTNRKCRVDSALGRKIVNNYVQLGRGANPRFLEDIAKKMVNSKDIVAEEMIGFLEEEDKQTVIKRVRELRKQKDRVKRKGSTKSPVHSTTNSPPPALKHNLPEPGTPEYEELVDFVASMSKEERRELGIGFADETEDRSRRGGSRQRDGSMTRFNGVEYSRGTISRFNGVEFTDSKNNRVVARWVGDKNGNWEGLRRGHCNRSDYSWYAGRKKSSTSSKKLKKMASKYTEFCDKRR